MIETQTKTNDNTKRTAGILLIPFIPKHIYLETNITITIITILFSSKWLHSNMGLVNKNNPMYRR